jgi:predicted ATPase
VSTINELIALVQKRFAAKEFDKFIHEMVFPKFKNFAPGAKIEFTFPITVLVGPNGGGKSSVLHAAWGMPIQHSTSRFWFSTPVDPIAFVEKDQNRYWYSHYIKDIDQTVQSRKMSGNKRHGYWEPTRPALKEGMRAMPAKDSENSNYMSNTGDRWGPVNRKVHYFNAKAESSAFDRFFNSIAPSTLETRQDYFVRYSRQLKHVIEEKLTSHLYYGIERVAENFLLTDTQLQSVNGILGKKYKAARYISHKLYDKHFSPSVIFETERHSYSECFAGSGELAVVNYVLALEKIDQYDLLLLDEPETSLHPGAQKKLIEHLLTIVKDKSIQVIVSTHSPTFVELLPAAALVVLDEKPDGVAPRAFPTKASAFHRLGQVVNAKIRILTEDKLLKAVVDRAMQKLPKEIQAKVEVVATEVGVSEMLSNQVRAHIQSDAKVVMVLDGDQKEVEGIFCQEPDSLSVADKENLIKALKAKNVSIVGSIAVLEGWMKWCKGHIVLLDAICPEKILLQIISPNHSLLAKSDATNSKFKSAVRTELHSKGDDVTPDAQYHILKHKLGEAQKGDSIDRSIVALSMHLKEKLSQFD